MENEEIRAMMVKYRLKYADILPFLTNFSHVSRISEELALPLTEERKSDYLNAIGKAKEKKKEDFKKIYGD